VLGQAIANKPTQLVSWWNELLNHG
jgi:hypothetical protein